jgi:hypothetical protein
MQRRIVASWEHNVPEFTGHFQAQHQSRRPIIAGWFYSTRLGDVGTSHSSLLCSLIYQILCQEPWFFHNIVADYYRKFPAPIQPILPTEKGFRSQVSPTGDTVQTDFGRPSPGVSEPASESFCGSPEFEAVGRQILERVAAAGTSIICIVDAMDEARSNNETILRGSNAERRGKILTTLGALARFVVGVEESKMKFILLSRPEPLIELDFVRAHRKLENTFRITLERENGTDIEVLVDQGITSLQAAIHTYDSDSDVDSDIDVDRCRDKANRRFPPGIHRALQNVKASEAVALERIREYILEHAQGVILWVTLILKDLQQTAAGGMSTFTELESRLRSLPLQLNDLYFSIIQGLRAKLTSAGELQKSRNIFTLVAGAGSFGRPLRLEELWEALAVPMDLELALQSKADPIISNRVIISSWSDFQRQLGRYCGPLIEILKTDEDEASPNTKELMSRNIVQFIHRTVKDFFERRKDAEEFRIDETEARRQVDHLARRYLALSFPRENPPYWPVSQATEDVPLEWEKNVESLVESLDSRILLSFSAHVVSTGGQPIQDINVVVHLMDSMVHPPIPAWNGQQIREHFSEETPYYAGLRVPDHPTDILRAVILGHAVFQGCLQGRVTAARNLVMLFDAKGQLETYTGHNNYVMLNSAMRAAIWLGVVRETRQLTRGNRHRKYTFHGRLQECAELDFVKLSIKAGFDDILRRLVSSLPNMWEMSRNRKRRIKGVIAGFQGPTSDPAFKDAIANIIEEAITNITTVKKREGVFTSNCNFHHMRLESLVRELGPTWVGEHPDEAREAVRVFCRLL